MTELALRSQFLSIMLQSKYYLTKEGKKALEKQYNELVQLRDAKLRGEKIPETWHSEEVNPDFLAYQEDLDFLNKKIEEYEDLLDNMQVIQAPPKQEREEVHIGALVEVEVDGEKDEFLIVGSFEANPMAGKISSDSPVGRALLGKKAGEEVVISSPVKTTYRVLSIQYK